ncbi:NAD(P)-dependent methylenetetrahydromethanopterin dehydrogenase [Methylobacillus flagellatus]|uniref:NAD(P)-dependent methylenetetrahydromethanopterin dehydrogenase n=1 Tax=Methylobacillus flagellatus TaxID=405 RepID=UPI0010F947E8|nr:NAD(P)-dependent methylenetetrahydromethanopterin dehydrogenase [Methylobacillus flagellatus]
MQKTAILHLITAARNASPFDVNMAFDAGFDNIMPYTQVALSDVAALTQDAIFSRSPSGLKREGIFIGGRDIDLAMDMLNAAASAMFPPFQISLFADPSGAFTTAAAMVAKVEQHLRKQHGAGLAGCRVSVLGATGPVGGCAAIIAAHAGAEVSLVAHAVLADVQNKAAAYQQRYAVNLHCVDGSSNAAKTAVLQHSDVLLCCAAAGIQVVSIAQMAASASLKLVADVNAVPPTGAEGVDVMADGVPVAGTQVRGIGALAIGNLKYATQHQLLKQMLSAETPQRLDFLSAFETARAILAD